MLKRPGVRREYERLQPEFEIASALTEARIGRRISQQEIARRANTDQAVISRLERAIGKPSLSLVQRVADALGLKVELHLVPK